MNLMHCDPITLRLYLADTDGEETRVEEAEFEVDSSLEHAVECWLDEYNTDSAGDDQEFEIDDRDVIEYDDDFPNPQRFTDLDEYGEHVEKVVEHGPAYTARWEDRGDFDFDDEYNGCWDSEEEFVEQLYTDCYEIPDHLQHYIDWEKLTRDFMMDYDSYYIDGEYHIFRA